MGQLDCTFEIDLGGPDMRFVCDDDRYGFGGEEDSVAVGRKLERNGFS